MVEPSEDTPPLEACGFVSVPSPTAEALWMTCEACGKSDHFWLDGAVRCRCGARYGFALRPDGSQVPVEDLRFVPFSKGPASLADTEWDPRKLAVILVLALGLIGLLGWWFLT